MFDVSFLVPHLLISSVPYNTWEYLGTFFTLSQCHNCSNNINATFTPYITTQFGQERVGFVFTMVQWFVVLCFQTVGEEGNYLSNVGHFVSVSFAYRTNRWLINLSSPGNIASCCCGFYNMYSLTEQVGNGKGLKQLFLKIWPFIATKICARHLWANVEDR